MDSESTRKLLADAARRAADYLEGLNERSVGPIPGSVKRLSDALGGPLPDARANLANAYAELGKHEQAETLYKRTLSIYEGQLGTEHPKIAAILSCLAALLRSVGSIAKANTLAAQAEAILSKHTDLQPSDWLHPDARGDESI